MQNQCEVPGGDSLFESVSVETIQETSEILSLLMLKGEFPSLSAMADL